MEMKGGASLGEGVAISVPGDLELLESAVCSAEQRDVVSLFHSSVTTGAGDLHLNVI